MINGKSVIGIVPARAGSKKLPRKNIAPLCGKPLIAWSIEAGLRSRYIDLVIVSTDSKTIAGIAEKYGGSVPFIRPAELATDKTPTIDVVIHALEYLNNQRNQRFDYTVLLEPTSPLREDNDIDRMLEQIISGEQDFDSIISVGEVSEHPSIMKRLVGPRLEPFCDELVQTTRRQDTEPAYFPYGVAYIAKTKALLAENTFYTARCTYFPIKRYQNYEIDDIYDFLCTESIMKQEWGLE